MHKGATLVMQYAEAYESATLYECICAVAAVSELDNDELSAVMADWDFGPRNRVITTAAREGNFAPVIEVL